MVHPMSNDPRNSLLPAQTSSSDVDRVDKARASSLIRLDTALWACSAARQRYATLRLVVLRHYYLLRQHEKAAERLKRLVRALEEVESVRLAVKVNENCPICPSTIAALRLAASSLQADKAVVAVRNTLAAEVRRRRLLDRRSSWTTDCSSFSSSPTVLRDPATALSMSDGAILSWVTAGKSYSQRLTTIYYPLLSELARVQLSREWRRQQQQLQQASCLELREQRRKSEFYTLHSPVKIGDGLHLLKEEVEEAQARYLAAESQHAKARTLVFACYQCLTGAVLRLPSGARVDLAVAAEVLERVKEELRQGHATLLWMLCKTGGAALAAQQ